MRYPVLLLALATPVTGAAAQRITVDLSGTAAELAALSRARGELARGANRLVPATLAAIDQAFSAARAGLHQAAVELARIDFDTDPPAPWNQQDPADSLYRGARRLLNNGSYLQAAALFARIPTDYPRSTYAADAYYWQAYAQYRVGNRSSLTAGLTALELQEKRYPKAGTRRDAESLITRIRSKLAQSGDASSRAKIEEQARSAAVIVEREPDELNAEREEMRRERDRDREEARRDREAGNRDHEREREQARAERDRARRERACDREDDDDRMAALNALLQMDEDKALPILKRVLARRDSGSVCLRRKAVFLVSQHEGTESEAMLLAAARNDPDPEVRGQAVFWLSQAGGDHAVVAIDSILRTSKDEELQEKALFALSQHDSPKAQQALRDYALKATNPSDLREKAIFWIGQSNHAEGGAFLKQLFGSVRDENLKEKVIFSISQQGGKDNLRWLLELAASSTENVEIRKKAIFWAGQGDASLPELFALYDRLNDRDLREHMIFVYSQRSEKAAVDRLIQIAKTEKDRELRKKAIFWLSQSNDPRVAQLLSDLLEKP